MDSNTCKLSGFDTVKYCVMQSVGLLDEDDRLIGSYSTNAKRSYEFTVTLQGVSNAFQVGLQLIYYQFKAAKEFTYPIDPNAPSNRLFDVNYFSRR